MSDRLIGLRIDASSCNISCTPFLSGTIRLGFMYVHRLGGPSTRSSPLEKAIVVAPARGSGFLVFTTGGGLQYFTERGLFRGSVRLAPPHYPDVGTAHVRVDATSELKSSGNDKRPVNVAPEGRRGHTSVLRGLPSPTSTNTASREIPVDVHRKREGEDVTNHTQLYHVALCPSTGWIVAIWTSDAQEVSRGGRKDDQNQHLSHTGETKSRVVLYMEPTFLKRLEISAATSSLSSSSFSSSREDREGGIDDNDDDGSGGGGGGGGDNDNNNNNHNSHTRHLPAGVELHVSPGEQAVCCDVTTSGAVAVGLASGRTAVFQITNDDLLSIGIRIARSSSGKLKTAKEVTNTAVIATKVFSMAPRVVLTQDEWGIGPNDTGRVTTVVWSSDATTLGIGTEKGGLSLWTLAGRRLFSTFQFSSADLSRSTKKLSEGGLPRIPALARGFIGTIAWGVQNLRLFVGADPFLGEITASSASLTPFSSVQSNLNAYLVEFPLFKTIGAIAHVPRSVPKSRALLSGRCFTSTTFLLPPPPYCYYCCCLHVSCIDVYACHIKIEIDGGDFTCFFLGGGGGMVIFCLCWLQRSRMGFIVMPNQLQLLSPGMKTGWEP